MHARSLAAQLGNFSLRNFTPDRCMQLNGAELHAMFCWRHGQILKIFVHCTFTVVMQSFFTNIICIEL